MNDLRPYHRRTDGIDGPAAGTRGYVARKTRALEGYATQARSDAHLPQWNASDKWNRHNFDTYANERPIHVGDFAPFGKPPVRRSHFVANASTQRANREFGLMWVKVDDTVAERAPDEGKHVIPRLGDIGRLIR